MIRLIIVKVDEKDDAVEVSVQRDDDKSVEVVSYSKNVSADQIKETIQEKCDTINSRTDFVNLTGQIFVAKRNG